MVYSGTLHVSTTTSDIVEEDQLSIFSYSIDEQRFIIVLYYIAMMVPTAP